MVIHLFRGILRCREANVVIYFTSFIHVLCSILENFFLVFTHGKRGDSLQLVL